MKSDTSEPELIKNFSNRGTLLKMNARLIAALEKRVSVTRFRVQAGDSVRLGYIRALTNLVLAQNTLLKEVELDNLAKELAEVKKMIEDQSGNQGSINGRSK